MPRSSKWGDKMTVTHENYGKGADNSPSPPQERKERNPVNPPEQESKKKKATSDPITIPKKRGAEDSNLNRRVRIETSEKKNTLLSNAPKRLSKNDLSATITQEEFNNMVDSVISRSMHSTPKQPPQQPVHPPDNTTFVPFKDRYPDLMPRGLMSQQFQQQQYPPRRQHPTGYQVENNGKPECLLQ